MEQGHCPASEYDVRMFAVVTKYQIIHSYSPHSLPNFTLWNYRIDLEKMDWGSWIDIMAKFVFDPETSYYDMQVPTVDTTKYG